MTRYHVVKDNTDSRKSLGDAGPSIIPHCYLLVNASACEMVVPRFAHVNESNATVSAGQEYCFLLVGNCLQRPTRLALS